MLHKYLHHYPTITASNFIAPSADLIGQVTLSPDASVWYNCTLRADINTILVGRGSNVQDNSVIHVSDTYGVQMGELVTVGHSCTIHACEIADQVLVGIGSILMDGVTVGKNTIIGANTLIPKGVTIPPGSLVVGSPARVLRSTTPQEIEYIIHLAHKYILVKNNYLPDT